MQRIRKISIGSDTSNQQVFVIGGSVPSARLTVTDIVQEQSNFFLNKHKIYYIWAKEDGGVPFLWYKVENMPVTIQYYK